MHVVSFAIVFFFFSSRRRHTRSLCDWSSDVCSSDLALLRWLHTFYGAQLGKLAPDAPLWVSLAHDASYGQPLGYQSINAVCKKYLGISRVHTTRHTAAHTMEKLGLTVSEIQARLGHKSLATTG